MSETGRQLSKRLVIRAAAKDTFETLGWYAGYLYYRPVSDFRPTKNNDQERTK
jgi:hypothetical protein